MGRGGSVVRVGKTGCSNGGWRAKGRRVFVRPGTNTRLSPRSKPATSEVDASLPKDRLVTGPETDLWKGLRRISRGLGYHICVSEAPHSDEHRNERGCRTESFLKPRSLRPTSVLLSGLGVVGFGSYIVEPYAYASITSPVDPVPATTNSVCTSTLTKHESPVCAEYSNSESNQARPITKPALLA